MNILILAWRDIKHPLAGGAERVMHEHAQAWTRLGHKVTLFTSAHPGSQSNEKIEGVKVIRRGYELLGVHIAAFFWYLFGKHAKFDLVVDHFHGVPFFTPWYVRVKKLAVVQEVAKEVWLLNHLSFPFNKLVGTIGYIFEPIIYLFYRKTPYMTASKSAKVDLINFRIPEENITIVQHGLSMPTKRTSATKEKIKTVMYLGALTRDKGIENAIEVFAGLSKRDPGIQFWVAGKGGGGYLKFIQAKVIRYGLKRKVKFWGFVSERKKFELLERAHVLINPSIREGWGLTVTEGSYVGTPTVGYSVAGLKDSIKPGVNGYLVPAKDTKKMETSILNLLKNPSLLEKLANSARVYAKKFTWENSTKESIRLITKILFSLNILMLNWKDIKHPEGGGAEQATLEHAKAWLADGHTVTWFASSFSDSQREENIKGIKIIRGGSQVLLVQLAAFWWYLFGKHNKFDLVVDQFHGIPFFTPVYVRVKKLAYIHEVAKEVWSLNPWPKPFNLIPALLGQIFEPWIFRIFYQEVPFMTVSESTKQDLVEWGIKPSNISVVYNGVSLDLAPKSGLIKQNKTAMFLGTLSRDKGVEDVIRTFGFINKIDSEWKFWIVGKGEPKYTNKLHSMSRDLGLNGKVKFWGYVNDKKKFELLMQAFVFVNPSVREGWGLVNIEANSVGTPVVAYSVAGVKDSVIDGETGLLSEFGDSSALAVNVLKLTRKKDLYNRLVSGGLSWSKKFTWNKATKESLALIESI